MPEPVRVPTSDAQHRDAPIIDGTLESVVWPIPVDEFLAEYLEARPLATHADERRCSRLIDALGSTDLEKLLLSRSTADVWYTTNIGETRTMQVAPIHAMNFYRMGRTVVARDVEELYPIGRILASALGYPEVAWTPPSTPSILATQAGGETSWHWDPVDAFTIQIRGSKRWRLARNEVVSNPLHNWITPNSPNDGLTPYLRKELPPQQPPEVAYEYTLEPGSMLYVPRGYLHTVTTLSDSMVVVFPLLPSPWVHSVADLLKEVLTAEPLLREHMPFIADHPAGSPQLRASVASVVEKVRSTILSITPGDFLAQPDGAWDPSNESAEYQRNPFTFFRVARSRSSSPAKTLVLTCTGLRRQKIELPLDEALVPLALFIAEGSARFSVADVEAMTAGIGEAQVKGLLDALLDVRAIRRVPGSAEHP